MGEFQDGGSFFLIAPQSTQSTQRLENFSAFSVHSVIKSVAYVDLVAASNIATMFSGGTSGWMLWTAARM